MYGLISQLMTRPENHTWSGRTEQTSSLILILRRRDCRQCQFRTVRRRSRRLQLRRLEDLR